MIKSKGFTLIEILLALVILAISLTALLKATADNLHNTSRIKEKSIKHWVAMQAISAIQLRTVPVTINQPTTQTTKMLGQTWYWQARVTPTFIKSMQQINITVSASRTGPFTDSLVGFRHD